MNLLETLQKYGRESLGYPSAAALKKIYSKNADVDADLRMMLFNPRKSISCPIGHKPTDTPGWFECVPEEYVPYLQVLIANRYSGTLCIRECAEALRNEGYNVSSFGQCTNIWDRMEHLMKTKVKVTSPKAPRKARGNQAKALANGRKIALEKRKLSKAEKDIKLTKRRLAHAASQTDNPQAVMKTKKTKVAQALIENEKDIKASGKKVLYEPTPKQADFHAAGEDIVLYGGAAGLSR